MDLTSVSNITKLATYDANRKNSVASDHNTASFGNVLQSAMNLLNETNTLANNAEKEALRFAMGDANSTHDLTIAQQKALTSLQYTVAVRNAVMDAYKEIMQIQF